ncbi:hypothetical protein [Enterococcus sp. LJL90]
MAEYEKDFILRQHKDLAKALSAFLEDTSVDDIMQWEQENGQKYQSDTSEKSKTVPQKTDEKIESDKND